MNIKYKQVQKYINKQVNKNISWIISSE